MELKTRKVSDLIPYINNSRTHSEEQITQIISSIKEFGFTNPILLEEENGIIAGHGRLLAVKKMGWEEVPCVTIKGLTKTQIKALNIADNQIALNAGWDLDKLSLEIDLLKDNDFDLKKLGFDDNFIKILNEDVHILDSMPELKDGDKEPFQQMTFILHDSQIEKMILALDIAKKEKSDNSVNTNPNGNAIFEICKFYCNQKYES